MKKKRHSILKYFAIFMIVGGLLTLLYPIVANYIASRERSEAVNNYSHVMRDITEEEKREQLKLAKEYNEYIFKRQQGENVSKVNYQNILRLNEVMGTVDIPAINIKEMPFYQGTEYQTLNKGLGHFEKTSIPIGGENTRSVITGHSGVKNQVLFTDVLTLKEGDIFFINILGEKLAYQIYSLEEVLPSEIDKINVEPGKDIVTLLTCTPPGINTFRLLVNGKRIEYKEAMELPIKKRNTFNYTNVVLTTLALNIIIFSLLFVLYKRFLKESQSKNKKTAKRGKKKLRNLVVTSRILFVILFVTMLSVLSFALYGYFKMQEEPRLSSIDVGINNELSHYNLNKVDKAIFDEKQIASVGISDYAQAKNMTLETTNEFGIGKLSIPQVGIDLPILAGLANQNLLIGASTYKDNQKLGEDNFVLLTHNIYEKDVLLHRIIDLKDDDLIYATDFENLYVYKVFLNKKIEETEMNYVDSVNEGEKPLITLLRCEGDIGTIYRRVVQGELIKVEPIEKMTSEEQKILNIQQNDSSLKGDLLKYDPVTRIDKVGISLAAKVVSDPIQTVIPIFFLFLMPILFFSFI